MRGTRGTTGFGSGDRIRGSSCMRAEDDGGGAMWSHAHAPEMRSAVVLEPQLSTGAGGGSPDILRGWRPDQPSVSAGPGCSEVAYDKSLRLVNRSSKRRRGPDTTEQGVHALSSRQ